MTNDYLEVEQREPIPVNQELTIGNAPITESYKLGWPRRDLEAVLDMTAGEGRIIYSRVSDDALNGPYTVSRADFSAGRVPAPSSDPEAWVAWSMAS